jgi:hypothetical protein
MSGVATAVVGGSVVSGIIGANQAAGAAAGGAQAQVDIAEAQMRQDMLIYQDQMRRYEQQIKRNEPYYKMGIKAISPIEKMVYGGYNMKQSPAAQYSLKQGSKSLNRQLAARGLLGSGNAATRLSELSSGIAAGDYNDQYQRLLDQIKVGTGASAQAGNTTAGMGNAANMLSQATQNASGNMINAVGNAANARASLYSGYGAAANSAINTGLNTYNAMNYGNMMNRYGSLGSSGGISGGFNYDPSDAMGIGSMYPSAYDNTILG